MSRKSAEAAARGPVVTIEVRTTQGRYDLSLNGKPVEHRIRSEGQVRELKDFLRKALEKFADQFIEPADAASSWKACDKLASAANSVVAELFGHGRNAWLMEERLNECYPGWRVAKRPALMTIVANLDEFLPLELLPLFSTELWPKEGSSSKDLWEAIRRFPSFSTVVRRQFPDISPLPDNDPNARVLENDPRLPLRFFWNDTLEGAALESTFFQQLDGEAIDLAGPWPGDLLEDVELVGALAAHLWDARGRYRRKIRSDQVQHFACHCDSDPELSINSRLGFRDDSEVTIAQLQEHIRVLARPRRTKASKPKSAGYRPLVFLNACRSSQIRPGAVTSFPHFFLDPEAGCRSRGVIGTEARVPDYFAAAFSGLFYRYLLSGTPLGEAVHYAKWDLLQKDDNPLGILYTIYADPNIGVRLRIPKLAPRPRGRKGV